MEKNLKVLMISSDRKLFEDGSAVSERLKEYGGLVQELHVVVLCDSLHGIEAKKLSENVWVYPTNSSSKFLRPFDAARMGKKIVLENKFTRGLSLITAQDPFECGWAGLRVKRRWKLPLEAQLHTDPFSPYFSGLLNFIRKRIAKKVLRHADSIRIVSESLKQKISKYNSRAEVRVLPIYVDKEKMANTQAAFDLHERFGWRFVLLCVSRLTPEKNVAVIIRALALARQKFPEIGLVVVGSGSEESRLKSLARKLSVSEHVSFLGWVEEPASYYKSANAFLQASSFEGYGLSLVEAGLSGLPVITTSVGIASEMEDNQEALICKQNSPESFANAILELVSDNQKRESLKINMKRFLDQHLLPKEEYMAKIKDNWEKTAARIS